MYMLKTDGQPAETCM